MIAVVQGFAPFADFDLNPSEQLVLDLARRIEGGGAAAPPRPSGPSPTSGPTPAVAGGPPALEVSVQAADRVVTEVLSVSRATVAEAVPKLLAEHRPDVWIGLGLAAGRPSLSVEAVAANLAGWEEPDNDGEVLERGPVCAAGPAAYLSTLPVGAILTAWREAGIPGYLSQSAGSYLCNMSFYLAAQSAEQLGLSCLVGFVHLPLLPEQVSDPVRQPSMAGALQAAGLAAVIEASRIQLQDGHPSESSGLYIRRSE